MLKSWANKTLPRGVPTLLIVVSTLDLEDMQPPIERSLIQRRISSPLFCFLSSSSFDLPPLAHAASQTSSAPNPILPTLYGPRKIHSRYGDIDPPTNILFHRGKEQTETANTSHQIRSYFKDRSKNPSLRPSNQTARNVLEILQLPQSSNIYFTKPPKPPNGFLSGKTHPSDWEKGRRNDGDEATCPRNSSGRRRGLQVCCPNRRHYRALWYVEKEWGRRKRTTGDEAKVERSELRVCGEWDARRQEREGEGENA